MNIKELDLLEKQDAREKVISRTEVLDKVGELLLLPNTEYATTEQVADYYKVDKTAIRQIITRNNDELEGDGIKYSKGNEIKERYDTRDNMSQVSTPVNIEVVRGGILINGTRVAYSSNALFPKRAILRVGMLLRDSEIAKEVRTRLLDIVHDTEKENPEIIQNITNEINEEKQLFLEKAEAIYQGDIDKICLIDAKLHAIKNKRIIELETENKNIKTHALTIIESRAVINRLVRSIAMKEYDGIFGKAFNELYSKVNYKLGINIRARNKKKNESYINTLTEEETFEVEKTVRSWAVEIGLDLDDLLKIAG